MSSLLLILALNSPLAAGPGVDKAPPPPRTAIVVSQPDAGTRQPVRKPKKDGKEESEEE